MIDRLRVVTVRLQFLKPAFVVLAILAIASLVAEVFFTIVEGEEDALLIPSSIVFLWSLIGFTGLNAFPHVPPDTDESIGVVARLKLRVVRFLYYGLGLVFVALTLAGLYMSYRLFAIWL